MDEILLKAKAFGSSPLYLYGTWRKTVQEGTKCGGELWRTDWEKFLEMEKNVTEQIEVDHFQEKFIRYWAPIIEKMEEKN